MRVLCLLLCLILSAIPALYAADPVIQQFTESMKILYQTSERCKDAVRPSPVIYSQAISEYVQKNYYNKGINGTYWVLPDVKDKEPVNANACGSQIQQSVFRYEQARVAFQQNYSEYAAPPKLPKLKLYRSGEGLPEANKSRPAVVQTPAQSTNKFGEK